MTASHRSTVRADQPLGLWLGASVLLAVFLLLMSAARESHVPSLDGAVRLLVDGDADRDARIRLLEVVRRRGDEAPETDRAAGWSLWAAGLLLDDRDAVGRAIERLGVRQEGPASGLPVLEPERADGWLTDSGAMERASLGEPALASLIRAAALATRGDRGAAGDARRRAAASAQLFKMQQEALQAAIYPGS